MTTTSLDENMCRQFSEVLQLPKNLKEIKFNETGVKILPNIHGIHFLQVLRLPRSCVDLKWPESFQDVGEFLLTFEEKMPTSAKRLSKTGTVSKSTDLNQYLSIRGEKLEVRNLDSDSVIILENIPAKLKRKVKAQYVKIIFTLYIYIEIVFSRAIQTKQANFVTALP